MWCSSVPPLAGEQEEGLGLGKNTSCMLVEKKTAVNLASCFSNAIGYVERLQKMDVFQ